MLNANLLMQPGPGSPDPAPPQPIAELRHVSRFFAARRGLLGGGGSLRAVDDASLRIFSNETVGLVGESGCGKSTLGRIAAGLLPPSEGEVRLGGVSSRFGKPHAGGIPRVVQMVFQDPFSSLNPRLPVGVSIAEPLTCAGESLSERREKTAAMLERVGLLPEHARRYPHQFSGGQRQRIAIARAIIRRPELVVCDEPVSSLDASVQAQMLNLFKELQKSFHLSYLFISHDLHVVGHMCDRIAVMYLGRIVELAPRTTLFSSPAHPYTRALLLAAPARTPEERAQAPALTGELPSPLDPPAGCPFHPRCPKAFPLCRVWRPRPVALGTAHTVCCHLYDPWAMRS